MGKTAYRLLFVTDGPDSSQKGMRGMQNLSTPKQVPYSARFAVLRKDAQVPSPEYSEELQRALREPEDLANPLYMSPTTYYTPGGDQQGDENH